MEEPEQSKMEIKVDEAITAKRRTCELREKQIRVQLNLPPDSNCEVQCLCHFGVRSCASVELAQYQKMVVVLKKTYHSSPWEMPFAAKTEVILLSQILKLKNTHLQRLINLKVSENQTFFISEFYPVSFKDMFARIQPDPAFAEQHINDLVKTVQLLHANGIAHRDIKSTNIVFDVHTNLVLIDFDSGSVGKSKQHYHDDLICTVSTRAPELWICAQSRENGFKGELEYDAFACDWWSVGCVICEMYLTGELLFQFTNETKIESALASIDLFCKELESEKGVGVFKRRMPTNVYSFIVKLLSRDPQTRIQAAAMFSTAK